MKNIRFQLMNHILSRKYSKYYQLCDSLALAVEPVENKRPIWKQLYWKTTSNVSVSAFPGRLCLCSVSLLRPQNVPAILFRASFRNFWGREKSTNLRSLVRLSESAVTLSSGMPPEDNEKSKSLFYIHPPMCTLGACLRLKTVQIREVRGWPEGRQSQLPPDGPTNALDTHRHTRSTIRTLSTRAMSYCKNFKPAIYTTISFICNHRAFWKNSLASPRYFYTNVLFLSVK